MTITDILNFANKYNLSDEARDELIKMIILNQTNNNKTKFNTTPYNPKLGPSDNIIASYDRLVGTFYLKDRNIIDEKLI